MLNLRILKILALAALLFFTLNLAYAVVDDNFGPTREIESKYFTIYCSEQLEIVPLLQQLDIQLSDEIIAGRSAYKGDSAEAELAGMTDTLFMRVSDILDMHLYGFHGTIKICENNNHLETIHNRLFEKRLYSKKSFYTSDLNTIYISADDLKIEILGHEMAHAIMSHYFAVTPPIKIQEVLATHTEFQLRKKEE